MATLSTIRKHGAALVIVIGIALFAFIAGDAAKVLQPSQNSQVVGQISIFIYSPGIVLCVSRLSRCEAVGADSALNFPTISFLCSLLNGQISCTV